MKEVELNRLIDHTLLKPEASEDDIRRLCREAIEYELYSVCVNTHYVPLVARELASTGIRVCSVAGFPLGAMNSEVKAFEAHRAVEAGAHEIDMVMNVGAMKSGNFTFVAEDVARVVRACGSGRTVKVIIEAALLADDEKVRACRLAEEGGAHFVKTSTGFGPPGATVRDVELMRSAVGGRLGVKASAGIRTAAFALELVRAGATRIGTSASVAIMEEWKSSR
jgi:deoxyribose-phosphate aldolase